MVNRINFLTHVVDFAHTLPGIGIPVTAGRMCMIEETASKILKNEALKDDNAYLNDNPELKKQFVLIYGKYNALGIIQGALTLTAVACLTATTVIPLFIGIAIAVLAIAMITLGAYKIHQINQYLDDEERKVMVE